MTMKHMRQLAALLAVCLTAGTLAGCQPKGDPAPSDTSSPESLPEIIYQPPVQNESTNVYADRDYGFQLEDPADGEEVAVLHTTYGDIAIRLFPEAAPKAVENFTTHIREGYYTDMPFYRVVEDFIMQSGDPTGTGTGGESIWGEYFENEFDQKLLNLRGALSMLNTGTTKGNSSMFSINHAKPGGEYDKAYYANTKTKYEENYSEAARSYRAMYESYKDKLSAFSSWEEFFQSQYHLAPIPDVVPDEVWELYDEVGGSISMDGQWSSYNGHTVFGQVFRGMDVVDALGAVEVDDNQMPTTAIRIKSAEMVTYHPDSFTCAGLIPPEKAEQPAELRHPVTDVYADRDYGFQLEKPAAGEEIAVLHTDKGDIRIRLFPEAAPKAVENFKKLVRDGYYNGLLFHRVIEGFMVQTGDPEGTGEGGESSFGKPFADEYDKKLLNLRGALAMANTGQQGTNESQFFINQARPGDETPDKAYWEKQNKEKQESIGKDRLQYLQNWAASYEELSKIYASLDEYMAVNTTLSPVVERVPEAVWELYDKNGGNIYLDGAWRDYGGHTVFGQVFEGMDVVDAIAAAETNSSDKPVTDIHIQSAEIIRYGG